MKKGSENAPNSTSQHYYAVGSLFPGAKFKSEVMNVSEKAHLHQGQFGASRGKVSQHCENIAESGRAQG